MNIPWDKATEEKFKQLLDKIPIFMRGIAEEKVSQRAQRIAGESGRPTIGEKEMVDAFFAETPFGFHGPMKSDMDAAGIDYTRYGHPK